MKKSDQILLSMMLLEEEEMTMSTTVEEIVGILKKNVDTKKLVDIDSGVEKLFDLSKDQFRLVLDILRTEGYQIFMIIKTQVGTGKKVARKVLAAPETGYKEAFDNVAHHIETDASSTAKFAVIPEETETMLKERLAEAGADIRRHRSDKD